MSTGIALSSSTLLRSTKLATVHSILGVSLTMAVVCVRAAIRLDGRRAHELRLPAAMAQANGGCDAVPASKGSVGWSHHSLRGLSVGSTRAGWGQPS